MNSILFIRHAETDMAGTFCGHSDPELNSAGHQQVADLVRKLRTENITAVYASDLRRAQTTAGEVARGVGVEYEVRPALREISFGEWEGLTWDEIEQRDRAYARQWIAEYPTLPAPRGEVFRDFEQRVLEEMAFLSAKASDRSIAVITHAGVMRIVLCSLCKYSEEEAQKQTNSYCAIVRHSVAASLQTQSAEVRS